MVTKAYEITKIDVTGVLAECGVEVGDRVLSINGRPLLDELDLLHADAAEALVVEVEKPDGTVETLEIEKDADESLGLPFNGQGLGIRRCTNHCVFCFIDQMPPGMRETLYVKDDDERLSYLQGNYVTLTNLSEDLKQRIIDYRLMPLNVSVHTTNPDLRCQMLSNRFAGSIMADLQRFSEHGINMNAQIVLCPGYNDGEELKKTLTDLSGLYPALETVSVVPVGLTAFRENLCALTPVDKEKAKETLGLIEQVQERMKETHGTRFVFPGDELFLKAELPIPDAAYYEDFAQLENGVGMMADFLFGLQEALKEVETTGVKAQHIGIITGTLSGAFMAQCAAMIQNCCPNVMISVLPVKNLFFGEQITVSGLVTGRDLMAQVKEWQTTEKNLPDLYLIPENMVRYKTEDFLDDVTVSAVAEALTTPVQIVQVDGWALVRAVTTWQDGKEKER